jgi:hypothetical protein
MGSPQIHRAVINQAEVRGTPARGANEPMPEDRGGLRTKLRDRMHIVNTDLSMKAVGDTEYL